MFADLTGEPGEDSIDGIKVDPAGNVFVCGPGGIWVIAPDGTRLGLLALPEDPHNLAWGGDDGRTLYVTALDSVYRLIRPVAEQGDPDASRHHPRRRRSPTTSSPDENGVLHRLSDLQGDDPMVLHLSARRALPPGAPDAPRAARSSTSGARCAFTSLVSLLPNDQHETSKLRISTGANWTFLADEELVVQRDLDFREYTDPHHATRRCRTRSCSARVSSSTRSTAATGSGAGPSIYDLWADLRDLLRRTQPDFDPLVARDPRRLLAASR